jgi:hypothetical protein
MNTKLTLTIDDKVIDSAKKYAREKGKSLSDIVENYLKSIILKEDKEDTSISPKILKLMGSVKLPPNFEYKAALGKALAKKYQK